MVVFGHWLFPDPIQRKKPASGFLLNYSKSHRRRRWLQHLGLRFVSSIDLSLWKSVVMLARSGIVIKFSINLVLRVPRGQWFPHGPSMSESMSGSTITNMNQWCPIIYQRFIVSVEMWRKSRDIALPVSNCNHTRGTSLRNNNDGQHW